MGIRPLMSRIKHWRVNDPFYRPVPNGFWPHTRRIRPSQWSQPRFGSDPGLSGDLSSENTEILPSILTANSFG